MKSLQPVRGTHDLLSDEALKHQHLVERSREICSRYGFESIETPIFEFVDVFLHTLGDSSDIVNKEMYVFEDKGGDKLALRPEGTAGIARAFISEGLAQHIPLKLFYAGPMFRYERPQKGRMRQFHQIGVELLGVSQVQADIEVISMAALLMKELGFESRVQLEINSIGDQESRKNYRGKLTEFLNEHLSELSEDSRKRLSTNPLRILDSKDRGDQKVLTQAPVLFDYLNNESKETYLKLLEGLDSLRIPYKKNPFLVRGLDYYSHAVFEFRSQDLGSQDAVLSGGRYDSLIETMGGSPTPGVGWAAGLERMALLYNGPLPKVRPIALVPLGEDAEKAAMLLAHELRNKSLAVDMAYSGNLSKRMKKANKAQARLAVIIGADELAKGEVTVKDLDTGAQVQMGIKNLDQQLKKFLANL